MISAKRTVRTAVLAALVAAAATSQIPLKNHSFDVVAASATVCTDGATFNGMTTAASSVGPLMTAEIWDATGTTLLATGNTQTFSAVNQTLPFTVPAALTAGATVALVVTNSPGSNTPLGGLEGDTATATVANCSIAMPATPAWGLALLAALLLAAGTLLAAKRSGLAGAGGGRPAGLLLLAALALAAAPAGASISPPTFSKVFSPDEIGPGSVSMLIFTIDNSAHGTGVGMLAFDDEFPGGVSFADPAFVSNSCGGTVTLDEGDADSDFDVRLVDGMVGATKTCQVVVNVTAPAVDDSDTTYMNVSGALTSDAGSSGTAADDLVVKVGFPGFSKSFAPNPVEFGGRSTLTFTIDNSANLSAETFLSFEDVLPAGMVIANPSNKATDCGTPPGVIPTLTAVPGTDVIDFFVFGSELAPAIAAGATCTVTVDVVGGAVGDLGNVSGNLEVVDSEFTGKAAAVLEVTGFATLLQLEKDFLDDPVTPGGTVTLEFKVTNKSRDDAATAITFSDTIDPLGALSPGLAPAEPLPKAACGGILSFAAGALTLTGGSLPSEGMCTFSVALSVPLGSAPGSYANTTTAVSGTIAGETETGNIAGDLLFIDDFPVLTKEFTDDPVGAGGSVTLSFTIRNTNSGSALMDIAFNDDLNTAIPTNDEGEPGLAANGLVSGMTDDPMFDVCGMGSKLTVFNPPDIMIGPIVFITPPDPSMLEFTGGSLAAAGMMGDSCTFDVVLDVREGVPGGVYTNTSGEVTGEFTGPDPTTGPPASGDVIVVGAPVLGKSFLDDPVAPGGTVTLEFSLAHAVGATGDATGIAFTDDLTTLSPAVPGLMATGIDPGTCLGTIDITTPTLIDFSGGSLMPGEECTFRITLSVPGGATPGLKTNTTSEVTATVGGVPATGSPAEDDLLISGFRLLKEFTDDPVIAGDTATLKFTLDNTSGTVDATAIDFEDELDDVIDGLAPVAFPPTPCGGTLIVTGGSRLEFSGGSVMAGLACDFDVTVLVPATIDPPGPPPPIPTPDDFYLNATELESVTVGATTFVPDPAVDTLEVNSTLLEITKEFLGDPVAPGGMVTLKFTVKNLSATDTVTDIAFSDDLGTALAGLTATAAVTNDCGGMGSGFPTTVFGYSGGGPLMPGASCVVSLSVTVPAAPILDPPPYVNTTSSVTGKVGLLDVFGDPDEDELLVQLLAIAKDFTDDPTTATGTVTLEFTLTNLGSDPVSDLAFTDNLSTVIPGLVATTLPPAGVCGTGSAMTGTSFLIFTGGSLAGNSFCVIPVTLTLPAAAPAGVFVNRTSRLRQEGIPVAPRATALLSVAPPPVFTKEFSPDAIGLSFTSTLTFTIDNTASAVAVTNADFLDMLPVGVAVASAPNVVNTCGGSVVAAPGSVSISLSNGAVAAGAACTLSVDVTVNAVGAFVNTTSDLTSSSGNSGKASDTLTGLGCTAADGANLTLGNDVVLGTKSFEVCNTITIQQHYLVLGPSGILNLTAGVAVLIENGVEFGSGSRVTIEIDPSLIP